MMQASDFYIGQKVKYYESAYKKTRTGKVTTINEERDVVLVERDDNGDFVWIYMTELEEAT